MNERELRCQFNTHHFIDFVMKHGNKAVSYSTVVTLMARSHAHMRTRILLRNVNNYCSPPAFSIQGGNTDTLNLWRHTVINVRTVSVGHGSDILNRLQL